MRVFVDDDAKFAALAEGTWGLAAARDFLYVKPLTASAAGSSSTGPSVAEANGMAGEIGLVTLLLFDLDGQLVPRVSRPRRRPVPPEPVTIASPNAAGGTVARTRSPSRP